MASFLVEAYTPASAAVAEIAARARVAAEELAREGMPVQYLRSIFIREDEICLHLYEAHSAEAVRGASERAGLSAQRIVEAVE